MGTAAGQPLHWNGKRNWCVSGNAICVCVCLCVNASSYKCPARLKRHKESQIININLFKFLQDTLTHSICNKDLEILYHELEDVMYTKMHTMRMFVVCCRSF